MMVQSKEQNNNRIYENDEIKVFWTPDLCTHATECWKANRAVFDPGRKPWVDVNAAKGSEIAAIIDKCPSGALRYELK